MANALLTVGGLVLATAFVIVQAFRVADRREPLGPSFRDSTCARTEAAIAWPVYLLFAVLLVVGLLI